MLLIQSRFLAENAKPIEDDFSDAPTPADILGARMVGRWKSGAPLSITPLVDDKKLADDPNRNNKFKFNPDSQEVCPFAAHIRKMNPRKDLLKFGKPEDNVNPHLILRRGIPFGPEVTTEEKLTQRTKYERGLHFVSYQSDLQQGFSFLQKGKSLSLETICEYTLTNAIQLGPTTLGSRFLTTPASRTSSLGSTLSSARSAAR